MSRRIFAVAALLAFAAPYAHAQAERASALDEVRESLERMAPRLELAQLFARLGDGSLSYETEDGVSMPGASFEVLVARIGTDGKPIMACADNEDDAGRFLTLPIERIQSRKAQDQ